MTHNNQGQNVGGRVASSASSFVGKDENKDQLCSVPTLVKSLMHTRVLQIASGGVHNICIVDHYPLNLSVDLYKYFMQSKLTDVTFLVNSTNERDEEVK
jgi:hypothetical protein